MKLFTPHKIISSLHNQERVKFLLVWRLSLLFLLIFTLLTLLFYFNDSEAIYTYLAGIFVTLTALVFLYTSKKYWPVFLLYALSGTILTQMDINLVFDSPQYGNFLWAVVIILLAFYGLGKKWGVAILIVNTVAFQYFFFFSMASHYAIMKPLSGINAMVTAIEMSCAFFLIGYLIYLSLKAQQLSYKEMKNANAILEDSLELIWRKNEEKNVLVKEIHHRVKNNLQIIISLLRLQMKELKNAEAQKHFTEAINRVMVMSSIHQKLYRQNDIAHFNLKTYIEDLASELKEFYVEEFPLKIEVESELKDIDLKTVVPLGLLLNELLSNSFKYAFSEKDSGEINIIIEDKNEAFRLTFRDNGNWKKRLSDESSFGAELIDLLTDQLDGTKQFLTDERGTTYVFELYKVKDQS